MTDWGAFSAADFDTRRAPKRAAKRAAEAAEAGQVGLFFVATPTVPAKSAPVREEMPGQADLFADGEDRVTPPTGREPSR